MANNSADNDVLMYFMRTAGSDAIAGESTSDLTDANSALMEGFKPGQYSEAENFTFTIKLGDDEGGVGSALKDDRSFARWRGLKNTSDTPTPPFRAEPDEVSIRRMIDVSSPVLLQYCLDVTRLDSVVMVKRARKGTEGKMTVVLRMEFKKVLIQAIEWEDGDTVMETCKFKFVSCNASYAKFKPNGDWASTVGFEWVGKVAKEYG